MRAVSVTFVALVAIVLLSSCNSTGGAPSSCGLLPGDLVITEIMANPDSADAGNEWFEVYNASSAELSLAGLTLEVVSGRGSKVHMIRAPGAPSVPARGYLALGDGVVGVNGLGYSYGTTLGTLPNESGSILVRCGGVEVDRVEYGAGVAGPGVPSSGEALQLTGTQVPEYHANDVAESWCNAETVMEDGVNLGTPGAPNTPCAGAGCDDGAGGYRPVRAPEPGELVVTEILSNSPGNEDHDLEWIEVYNAGTEPVDLLGVEVQYGATCQSASALVGSGCLTVAPGGYAVLAGDADAAVNGGVTALATFGGTGLINDNGCVALRVKATEVVIDQASYGKSTDGHAFALDPTQLDATLNDDQAAWCVAAVAYGTAGGYGSPGVANPTCGAAGCDDGAGGTRPARVPEPGELVITEILSNSPGTEDHAKEWIEVYNPTGEAIDLIGVEVQYGATCQSASALVGDGCLTIPAGEYAVLAGSADAAANGGVTPLATFGGSGLRNDAGCVALRVKDTATVVDQATYGKSTDGHAFSLDPGELDAIRNDDQAVWCEAAVEYGTAGGFGSPGAANPVCAAAGCDDGQGGTRAPRGPAPGELVITEILSNTPGAEDHQQEWIEVYNTTGDVIDLLGVEVRYGATCQSASALVGDGCLTVPAGGYAVLAGSADPAANGGVTALATFGGSGLRNDAGCVALRVKETEVVVDQTSYGVSVDGRAFSLDPNKLDATLNDDRAAWCVAGVEFGTAGGFGSPGAANPACAPAGCDDGAGGTRAARAPLPGELVITEILSNTPGAEDHQQEWIEVYNTTAEAIDLLGVQVLYGATCQSAIALVGSGCLTVPPASYAVLAGSVDPATNGGLVALASFGGSGLLNDNGCVALRVEETQAEIDRATYGTSTDGSAVALDPSQLDATANDDPAHWCAATVGYGTGGALGTPGLANLACGITSCVDGTTPRAAVAPAAGTVFVTEVFSNPAGADTPAKEWFEVRVTQDCDLNGLKVTNGNGDNTRVWTLAASACMHVTAGSYVVIAGSTDPLENGGLPTNDIFAVASLSLYNSPASAGALTLTLEAGGAVIDSATFPTPADGKSVSLDPNQLDATSNDVAANFCAATTTTTFSGTGTPGGANDPCS